MTNINLFTHPGTFRRIQPQYLHAWLLPHRDYLAGRGFGLADTPTSSPIDFEALVRIFMEPDAAMPRGLMHSASMIHEMANDDAMRALLDGARDERITLEVGDDPDPGDVAVQMYLADSGALEDLHNRHQLDRPRSFLHFSTDRDPVPAFREPSDVHVAALEAELAEWNFLAKRGRSARMWVFKRPGERWFLIRHGLASRRQEIITPGGSESVLLRPGEYDVCAYDMERGEIRIHGCNPKEVDMLRRTIGAHFFSDPEFFPGREKFTLAPLLAGRSCLVCDDFPMLASVVLTEVQVMVRLGRDWLRTTYKAPDLFNHVERGGVVLPHPSEIAEATFEFRFKDAIKRRKVTVAGCNRLKVVRDGDTTLLEQWLASRGFELERVRDENETGVLALA